MSKNFYEILELNSDSKISEIKTNYKKLAMIHHPDKGGNSETFKGIAEAYRILSDEKSKAKYDKEILSNINISSTINDIFSELNIDLNSFSKMKRKIKKMEDNIINVDIELQDTFYGNNKKILINLKKYCFECKINCKNCNDYTSNCKYCNDTGLIKNNDCNVCKSIGYIVYKKIIEINIPKDMQKTVIIKDYGEQPMNQIDKPGDLIIHLNYINDKNIYKKNKNYIYKKNILLLDSIIGKKLFFEIFNEIICIDFSNYNILNPTKKYLLKKFSSSTNKFYIKFIIDYNLSIKLRNEIKNLIKK